MGSRLPTGLTRQYLWSHPLCRESSGSSHQPVPNSGDLRVPSLEAVGLWVASIWVGQWRPVCRLPASRWGEGVTRMYRLEREEGGGGRGGRGEGGGGGGEGRRGRRGALGGQQEGESTLHP